MNQASSYGIPSSDPLTHWNNHNEDRLIGFPIGVPVGVTLAALGAWLRSWKRECAGGATEGVANQAANEAFRDTYKTAQGCMDCDGSQRWPSHALHLDHRDDSEKAAQGRNASDVTRAANIRWPSWRYVLEVSKCDVVCGHHHDVRTEARAQGIDRDEAARRIDAARRAVVLGAMRAEGVEVETRV
jgi:hypothetical protein